jgi:MraZ protein
VNLLKPFVATYHNKIDAKGRVSVPARFRLLLADEPFQGVYCMPSPFESAIHAGGSSWLNSLSGMIGAHDPTGEAHDTFAYALLAKTSELSFDGEGRVVVPEALLTHAGITEQIAFVGLGTYFAMWEPKALDARIAEAQREAMKLRGSLQKREGIA